MMDYEQHLVFDKFKVFDGAWFLVNINDKLGFAHCLDYIDLKIFEHHYMNNYVDTVFNGWQCLVKYVFKVSILHHWACPMCLCGTLRWSGGGGVVEGLLPSWKFHF